MNSLLIKKNIVRIEVEKVEKQIKKAVNDTENILKTDLKRRVRELYTVIDSLYNELKDKRTKDEIVSVFVESIRNIRFNDGRGYYFAATLDGVDLLYPVSPEVEGKNVIELEDNAGNKVIQEEIKTSLRPDGGFVNAFWKMPEKDGELLYPKISYVLAYKPLNFYFGVGDYYEEVKNRKNI